VLPQDECVALGNFSPMLPRVRSMGEKHGFLEENMIDAYAWSWFEMGMLATRIDVFVDTS